MCRRPPASGRAAALPKPLDRRSTRNNRLVAYVTPNGDQLHIQWPCRAIDDFNEFNGVPIALMCHELTEGEKATDPAAMLEQMAELRAKVAALEGAAV